MKQMLTTRQWLLAHNNKPGAAMRRAQRQQLHRYKTGLFKSFIFRKPISRFSHQSPERPPLFLSVWHTHSCTNTAKPVVSSLIQFLLSALRSGFVSMPCPPHAVRVNLNKNSHTYSSYTSLQLNIPIFCNTLLASILLLFTLSCS